MIEKLKQNWTAWGGLTEEERAFLVKHQRHVGLWSNNKLRIIGECSFDGSRVRDDVFRLSPGFTETKSHWVEVPVHKGSEGIWFFAYDGYTFSLNNPPASFGGVKYKGFPHVWVMDTAMLTDGEHLDSTTASDSKHYPATPEKVRLWV